MNVGDIVIFDPVTVDNPDYWDDYAAWKKGSARIEQIEKSGHPFLHCKVRSVEKPALVGAMVNMLNAHGLGDKTLLLAPSAMASAVAADKVREANDIKECAHHMTIHCFAKMTAEESDMGTEYGYDFDDADELLSEGSSFSSSMRLRCARFRCFTSS